MTPEDERFSVADDAVDTMLRSRADRLAPGATASVRERVHGELRERRPAGILGFLPIGDRAGSMSGLAGWGVAVAAAVLVIAVLGGRPTGDPSGTAAPAGPRASPGAPAPPGPSALPEAGPGDVARRLDPAAFRLAVADGSLDGQIVLVNGALAGGTTACTEARCDPFWFSGLEKIPVNWKGPAPKQDSEPGYPASTPVPGVDDWWDGPFLVRPGDGQLELLGYLAGVLENPVTVQVALEDLRGFPNDSSPFDILPVQGYLIDGCRGATVPCDGHGPILADSLPGSRPVGGRGAVTVLEPAPSPGASAIVEGPFLVRFERPDLQCPNLASCTLAGWGVRPTVLGQYEPEAIVRVDLASR